jgi:thioredoxin reductase
MVYDVVIVGGGPGGLSAALALGRARKRVLVCDSGPRRNAAATHIHNFVTRDGTPPNEFRQLARQQLAAYDSVDVKDVRIAGITGSKGAFQVALSTGTVQARRILLATGMVDEMLPIERFRELWGRSIFQCPYCHGWENRDRRWGFLVLPATLGHAVPFGMQLRSWTREVAVFTNGVALFGEARAQLEAAKIPIHDAPIKRLAGDGQLSAIELADGTSVPCDALFAHPPQQQVELVRALGLELDDDGFVKADPMKRETSIPGIYIAGDSGSRMQAAIAAAASATQAAAMINMELSMELVAAGAL